MRKPTIVSMLLSTAILQAVSPAQALQVAAPNEAASAFSSAVSRFVAELDVETEAFSVRINRCQGKAGEFSDAIYYVRVGWRGVARAENAGKTLSALRTHWAASNWRITRDRDLENGGVNIAAIEPITGNTYSLDSGFDAGPTRYIVGYFGTPCLTSPTHPAPFGAWSTP